MTVLGIDPGLRKTGYGIVRTDSGLLKHVADGIISLDKIPSIYDRLSFLYDQLNLIIEKYSPQVLSLEKIFTGKNVRSAFMIGEARAIAILSAKKSGLQIFEYTPREVKQGVTGYGNASKEEVKKMVKLILNLRGDIRDDASDALALAIYYINVFNITGRL